MHFTVKEEYIHVCERAETRIVNPSLDCGKGDGNMVTVSSARRLRTDYVCVRIRARVRKRVREHVL